MSKLSKSLATVGSLALLSAPFAVSAASYDMGTVLAGENVFSQQLDASDSPDTWQFTLAETSDIDLAIVSADLELEADIGFGTVTITIDGIGDFEFNFDGGDSFSNGQIASFEDVVAGTYTFDVSGTSDGFYSGTLNVAPVPLPAGVWLLGTALAGMGLFSRRRNRLEKYS